MPSTTDPPVRRIETPTGLTFLFPPLPPGPVRSMAGTLLLAGLILLGAGLAAAGMAADLDAFPTYGLYFTLLAAAGVCTAAVAALLTVVRTEIHLDEGQLIAVRRIGPLGWPRLMPINLTGVTVLPNELAVAFIGGRRSLAWGYPPEWLLPVARELGVRLGVPVTDESRPS